MEESKYIWSTWELRVDALILVGDIVIIGMSNLALAMWSKVRSMAIAGICRWMNHVF